MSDAVTVNCSPPLIGCVLLAFQSAGIPVSDSVLKQLDYSQAHLA